MRISLSSLGQDLAPLPFLQSPVPFAQPSISTNDAFEVNGRMISAGTGASTPLTAADCLPYQCGHDLANQNARYWCAYWGQSGVKSACTDPDCAPWRSEALVCPAPSPTPTPIVPIKQPPVLTPQNIVQPLPDITATFQPVPLPPPPMCSLWCDLQAAIAAHPGVSAAVVIGLGILLWPKGGR